MKPDLNQLHEKVIDEESFIVFLTALAEDREDEIQKEQQNPSSPYGSGANGWENRSIEAFLSAASVWAESSKNGLPLYEKPDNAWKRFADIMLMGKLYE